MLIALAIVTGLSAETFVSPGEWSVVGPALAAVGTAVGLRRPVVGVLVVACAPLAIALLGHDPVLTWTIAVFATFLLTLRGLSGYIPAVVVGVANYLAVVIDEADRGQWSSPSALVAFSLTLVAAVSGSALRTQIGYFRSIEQRARDAIEARDAEANRRVVEERLRIARDLHDVIGHEVAVLGMHLGVAEVSTPADGPARAALASARAAVQSVLRETQRLLDLLRPDAESESRAPAPGIAEIPALIDSYRVAGLRVDAHLPEYLQDVSGTAGVTAYRMVQEALTNAQRHGDGAARVDLELTPDLVRLEVANAIRGGLDRSPGRGYGLIGMRERAQSAGGRVRIGPHGNQFRVEAVLPRREGGAL